MACCARSARCPPTPVSAMVHLIWTCTLLIMMQLAQHADARELARYALAPQHTRSIQQLQEAAAVNETSVRLPLTTNKTCTSGEAYIDCYINPCDYFPCPVGYLGEANGCGGTCRCRCRADVNATSVTSFTGVTGPSNATSLAANTAAANAAQQQLFPDEQQQQQGQCSALFDLCTCSAQCCGALECAFPLRGRQESSKPMFNGISSTTAWNCSSNSSSDINNGTTGSTHTTTPRGCSNTAAVANAGSRWGNMSSSSSSNSSHGVTAAADENVGGPSCRTLGDIDGISGIVDYGC